MNSVTEIWGQLAIDYGSRIALKDENTGYSLSFTELNNNINKVSQILDDLNLNNNSNILLCLKPHPLWHVVDQAIMKSNFVSVLADPTSSLFEIKNLIDTMQIKVLFTDNIKLIQNLQEEYKLTCIFYVGLLDVNTYNNKNLHIFNLIEQINKIKYKQTDKKENLSNTIASIMFSSGTTGKSKGAMFTHENLLLCLYDYQKVTYPIKEQICVNILSLAHVAPRINEWALLSKGNTIIYTNYVKYLETINKYKPYFLMCVPRLLSIIIERYKKECLNTSKLFQVLNTIAFNISYKYYKFKLKYNNKAIVNLLNSISLILNFVCHKYFIRNIISKFMNPKTSIIAFGASTDEDLEGIINTMGLNLMAQYGMTEASVISYNSCENKKAYSVGKINQNMDIIISDLETGKKLDYNKTGIIKVKGKQIMRGYYNNDKDTKEVFDKEGYIITGDLGYIDEEHFLFFVGRYKNIIVLNNGENIDSVKIENICNKSNFVEQIVLFGQDKPYLTAIIVPNQDYIKQWSQNRNIDINIQANKELLKKEIIIDINNLIGTNKFFRWIEQVKDIVIINEPFTIDNGLLTRKYTIIRSKVYNQYKTSIENMYK